MTSRCLPATALGDYNEGTIGPGHCDEDTTADRANLLVKLIRR